MNDRPKFVTLNWADGEYKFDFGLGEIKELQEKCGAGPPVILRRLQENAWFEEDVRETIRLGLIGGGTAPVKALILMSRYHDTRPRGENVLVAAVALHAYIFGASDPEGSKKKRAKKAATRSSD